MSSASLLRSPRNRWILGVLLAAGAVLWFLRPSNADARVSTFTARRGPLDITVLGGGSVEALESWQIRSEVRGEPVKILKLVDEGTLVSEEDVRTNKVLVELDASKIQQALLNQDISFQTTLAGLTEAQQGYEIQLNQGRVDMRGAEQDAKFAFMDLEKLLGRTITAELVQKLDLVDRPDTNLLARAESGQLEPDTDPGNTVGTTNAPIHVNSVAPARIVIDFSRYANVELLGDGTAKQELRKREDELLVTKTALGQAQTKLAGTKRLFEKGFVTKTELENDQIAADQARLKVESAQTTLDLYLRYEFTKSAEETLSKYEKALRTLERVRKEAVSKLAQSAAKMKSAERRYRIEKENRDELAAQIQKAVITAQKPGLVVYGGNDNMWWGGNEPIRVGSQVFERQPIITIPDTTQMGVKLGIHESHIKRVSKGLKVKITVDAFPDDPLTGEVRKVGVLPDSQGRFMSPDMKLYQCTIAIQGSRDWVKPGMSAKVEILVKQLPDVVYVPIQAVTSRTGKQLVFLPGSKPREREVTTGEFNESFIEIRKGLEAGETVLLRLPDDERQAGEGESAPAKPAPSPAGAAKPVAVR